MIWRLTAIALFGIASIAGPAAATGSATLGFALLCFSFVRPDLEASPALTRLATAVLAVMLVVVGSRLGSFGSPQPSQLASAVWIAGSVAAAVLVAWPRSRIRSAGPVFAGILIVVMAVGTAVQYQGDLFGLDIYRSHEAAADALAAGENPYTDAVRVLDGSPNAEEGAVIEGYGYPPVTLVLFSIGDWIGGDPRWASVLAILVGLALVVRQPRSGTLSVLAVVLLAATPTLRWIVWSGATEPVSYVLLIVAAILWRRPLISGVILGLALATKQYLVILVPLVILLDERPWKRTLMSVGVAGATLAPAIVADPEAFWYTMVERPLSLGFRADTQSIAGALDRFGWRVDIPAILMVMCVLAVTWVFTRLPSVAGAPAFLGGSAVALSVMFLLSLAFTNYWWLVQWLAAGATLLMVAEKERDVSDSRVSPGTAV